MTEVQLSGCTHAVLNSKTGYSIATYTWEPESSVGNARGVVLLVHGLAGWTAQEWLSLDESKTRRKMEGSLVQLLLDAGFVVVAYDQPGHGQSSGLKSFVESFDVIRDVAVEVCTSTSNAYSELPLFLVGMSLGATTCVMASIADTGVAVGTVLLSPAVHTPSDMFGLYGSFLRAINRPLSWLIPKVPIMSLPLPEDPSLKETFLSDPLNYTGPLRVRMGAEFVRIYEMFDKIEKFNFQNLLVIAGTKDQLVDVEGIEHFFQRCEAKEKKIIVHDDMGHELLHEVGLEKVQSEILDWISSILPL